MVKQLTISVLTAIGLTLGAASAHAQDASLNRAREAFDRGQSLFEQGKYDDAAEQFKEAYEARPFAQFLFNTGACYEKAGNYEEALSYYERYMAENPPASEKSKTTRRITALKKAIEELKAVASDPAADPNAAKETPDAVKNLEEIDVPGLVVIESEPQGAMIYLDGKKSGPLSKTPWNGTLEGEHLIRLELEGYKPREKKIRPSPNKLLVLFWGLEEEDYLGWIDITSNVPGAEIYIDDKSVGVYSKTPYSGNLSPGVHKIWITKQGYNEIYQEVKIVAGETHKIDAVLEGSEVGYLNVRGRDVEKMTIYLDGKVLCERGPCRPGIPPGVHKVEFKRSGYKTYAQVIDVQSKTEVTIRARLAEEPGRADAVIAYIASAAFIGGGIWAGLRARDIERGLEEDIEAGNPPPDPNDSRFFKGKVWAISADAAIAVGSITFLTAVYYTFRDKGAPSTGTTDIRAVSFEPTLNPGYAGLDLGVRW